MAKKITLTSLRSGFNTAQIQDNFDKIEAAFNDKVLWRDQTGIVADNAVKTPIDMNGQRMVNLPAPVSATEPLRVADSGNLLEAAASAKASAELAAARAQEASTAATTASQASVNASQQAGLAGEARNAAEEAADEAELWSQVAGNNSRLSIGTVTTGTPGSQADASITGVPGQQNLNLTIPTGPQGLQGVPGIQGTPGTDGVDGDDGEDGRGIVSVEKTAGTGGPGSVDTYTITYTDTTTSDFQVYNGADGTGTGDVSGPASSTNLSIAVFDGITGKVLSSSGTTISDLQNSISQKVDQSNLSENIDDRVAELLVAGANVTLTYNDVNNTITVASTQPTWSTLSGKPTVIAAGATSADARNVIGASPLVSPTFVGLRETYVAMAANNMDLNTGNVFSKTISAATTFTVSNLLAAPAVNSWILELTNGGSASITYPANTKWAGGTAPTLTAAGKDVLGFYTRDGGTTINGFLLGKDVK